MKLFRKGRSAAGGWKPVKGRATFERQVQQCALSFSIDASGGGTSLWLEFEPADFEAMALAMMRANPEAAREAFLTAQEAFHAEG